MRMSRISLTKDRGSGTEQQTRKSGLGESCDIVKELIENIIRKRRGENMKKLSELSPEERTQAKKLLTTAVILGVIAIIALLFVIFRR
jgi:hypothetical protein